MQPDEIIKQFEVYVDDLTELSSAEEYSLLSKVLDTIYNDRSWEFLRKAGTAVTTTATTAPLPADFVSFMNNYTEDPYNNIPEKAVVYVGNVPYQIIPMGARNQFVGGNYAYADILAGTITFTISVGSNQTVTFDYKYQPSAITSNASIIALPATFRRYIPQVMAIDDDIIQKMEKARSNYDANMAVFNKLMRDLAHYNARFLNV